LVDDGGDATMMILEGQKYEEEYEKNGTLPDPKNGTCQDEVYLLEVLRDTIPSNSKRWRNVGLQFMGVSEETTTGVHRLY